MQPSARIINPQDETVEIVNSQTGERKKVLKSQLSQYGIDATQQSQQTATPPPQDAAMQDQLQKTGFFDNLVNNIAKPFVNTGKNILGAPIEAARAFTLGQSNQSLDKNTNEQLALAKAIMAEKDPAKKKQLAQQSKKLADSGETLRAGNTNVADFQNPFLSTEDFKKIQENPRKYVTQQVKDSAEIASYGVPFGEGANIYTKAILPGALVGGVNSAVQEGATGTDVIKGALGGAVTGGVTQAATSLLPKIGGAITKGTGSLLEKSGDNIGLKALKLSPSQINKIQDRWGEKVTSILDRNGVMGRNAGEIKTIAIDPLQQSFDDIARKSGVQIPLSDIDAKYLEKINVLLNAGDTESMKLADKLLNEYDSISKTLDPLNDISKITEKRALYSNKVKNWNDLLASSNNEISSDVFREVAQEAADKAGLKSDTGQTLKELGLELGKLRSIQRSAALQESLGKGSQPLGITNLLGIVAGGSGGGVPGAATALGATLLANNPTAMRIYSRLAQGAGRAGQAAGSTGVTGLLKGGGNIVSQAAIRLPSIVGNSPQSNNNQNANTQSVNQNGLPPITPDTTTTQPQSQVPAGTPAPEIFMREYTNAINAGDTTTANKIKTMYDNFYGDKGFLAQGKEKPVTAAIKQREDLSRAGLRAQKDALDAFKSDPNIVLKGTLSGGLLSRKFDSAISRAVEGLLRARSGAAVPDSEVRKYKKDYSPAIGDTMDVALYKLEQLRLDLNDALSNNENVIPDVQSGQLPQITASQ